MNENNYTDPREDAPFTEGGSAGSQYHYSGEVPTRPEPESYTYDPADYMPQKPRKNRGGWAKRALSLVLVGAVAFAGGWGGTTLANRQSGKVIVQQAAPVQPTPESEGGSPAAAAGALSSVQVAEKVSPSVVAITTEKMVTSYTWFGGSHVESGAGSGVIFSEDGYILTCAHVIEGADTIKVELSDGTEHAAALVGSYPEGDIAVIKIEAEGLVPATLGDSAGVLLGEPVWAVGNPEGMLSGTVTDGIISSLDREITVQIEVASDDTAKGLPGGFFGYYGSAAQKQNVTLNCLQMSAQVSPGNSGGGLFNNRGELIGIVNAKSSGSNAEGLGFAIPSNTAMEIAGQLISAGSYEDPETEATGPILGITAVYLTEEEAKQNGYTAAGVYVYQVTAQSTADAGLASGDRIISVDDAAVGQIEDIAAVLADKQAGDTVTLLIERGGRMGEVTVTLVERG